ncbi:alpha/beta hydrolase [Rhodococcoides fascians]|uniref:alpha/beta hydrolase n=1 Tax=Rhodococcoides fascians TaxID=1828 RepID=UPI000690957E|nr:alpha/beta hydrolase [Rhodococcus fascians]
MLSKEWGAVSFDSEGTVCAGDLYLPTGYEPSNPYPALVICHGFTVRKETLVSEGKRFAAAGYVTLAIDYRHFGESGGEPRGRLFPSQEVEDVRNAITWLQTQPGVDGDRIGIWGTSFGGGIVTYVAAVDRRVKAVVAQAPILDGYKWLRSMRSDGEWDTFLGHVEQARLRRSQDGPGELLADSSSANEHGFIAIPPSQEVIAAVVAHQEATGEMMLHAGGQLELESVEKLLEFDAVGFADRISPRAYCVIALSGYDVYHPRESIQAAFARAGEPKALRTVGIDQLDIYWEWGRDLCIPLAVDWFDTYLTTPIASN